MLPVPVGRLPKAPCCLRGERTGWLQRVLGEAWAAFGGVGAGGSFSLCLTAGAFWKVLCRGPHHLSSVRSVVTVNRERGAGRPAPCFSGVKKGGLFVLVGVHDGLFRGDAPVRTDAPWEQPDTAPVLGQRLPATTQMAPSAGCVVPIQHLGVSGNPEPDACGCPVLMWSHRPVRLSFASM